MSIDYDLVSYFSYAIQRKEGFNSHQSLIHNYDSLVSKYFELYKEELSSADIKLKDVQESTQKFLIFISTYTFPSYTL